MKTFIPIFLIHGIFLMSVFDIYFKTNVLTGLNVTENTVQPPAKRIVLFVCDGLPAEYLFDYSTRKTNAPFLRSIAEHNGSWGLSYTRVPTESRPGHVALIAGLYEDPSAVFKGWKENPVSFDSVFNHSDATFMFGCNDILHLFGNGTGGANIYSYSYPSEKQDYSGKKGSASELDNWVLTEFIEFEKNISANSSLYNIANGDRIIFFFHLLGVDVAGHASKPMTTEYFRTIRNADRVVRELTMKLESIFRDNKTTYLFTSDHGMTSWGSHGAGSAIETVTPIVAWGAGIKQASAKSVDDSGTYLHSTKKLNSHPQPTPAHWGLSHLVRHNINQADLAVLMSVIIGVPIPVNSVGILPHNLLKMRDEDLAMAYLLNAKQLMEQFKYVENKFHNEITPIIPTNFDKSHYDSMISTFENIKIQIEMQHYGDAVNHTDKLINDILSGIQYYEFYFQNTLLIHVLLGFAFLMVGIVGKVLRMYNAPWLDRYKMRRKTLYSSLFVIFAIFVLEVILFIGGVLPTRLTVYTLGTWILMVWAIIENPWVFSLNRLIYDNKMVLPIVLHVVTIEFLMSAFWERKVMTFIMMAFSVWPMVDKRLIYCTSEKAKLLWCCSSLALAFSASVPISLNKESFNIKFCTGIMWILILNSMRLSRGNILGFFLNNWVTRVQLYLAPVLLLNTFDIARRYSNGGGLMLHNKIASFTGLIVLLGTMRFGAKNAYPKFVNICFSVGISFLLLSVSLDALFPLFLSVNLMHWLDFECKIYNENYALHRQQFPAIALDRKFVDDFRKSLFFMLYIFLSFFGIGNLASINSFDTNWTRSFTDTFSPYLMMTLIILRTALPIFLVCCAFRCIIIMINGNAKALFMMTLLYCNLIAAQFLFMVENQGSWLDIGTSLSRFIIIESLVLIILPLYYLAKLCTANISIFMREHMHLP